METDFEVNIKAEQEIEAILRHLEYQNQVLTAMMEQLGLSNERAMTLVAERSQIENVAPGE